MRKINFGIIGVGYWGPNIARNIYSIAEAQLYTICDLNKDKLTQLQNKYPEARIQADYKRLLKDKEIDAVVIATPPVSHFKLAHESLRHGKHVLVEKPLALKKQDAQKLIDLAAKNKRILMTGHTFIYNAAVRKLKEYVKKGEIGKVYYIYSQRLNLGIVRKDINAMWNFSPHDISIILYVLDALPYRVSAIGLSYLQKGIEDVVYINLDFENGVSAHIHVSWLDPNKVRRMTVVGSKKMIVYDDVSINEKIQIYDKGFKSEYRPVPFRNFGEFQLIQRSGKLTIPEINFVEPLRVECKHFIDCIRRKKPPVTDGVNGLNVVKILESVQKSIRHLGRPVEIDWGK